MKSQMVPSNALTPDGPRTRRGRLHGGKLEPLKGFTLIEMMVTVAIAAILAGVALPSYQGYVVRTRRAQAAVCVTDLAQFMERVYAANNSYSSNGGSATVLPATPCINDLTSSYSFGFATGQPQTQTFTVQATPINAQASNDAACGKLTLTHAGVKGISGTSTVAQCWR